MSIQDPNWFYSSLSQVSAAIVGLTGGLFGTRLVSHVTDTRGSRLDIDARMKNADQMLVDRTERFANIRVGIANDLLAERARLALVPLERPFPLASLRERIDEIRTTARLIEGKSEHNEQTRMLLNRAAEVLEELGARVGVLQTQTQARPFRIIIAILAFLTLGGILWPLAALSGLPWPFSKWGMLFLFAIAMLALFGYFGFELYDLSKLARLSWNDAKRR